MRRAFFLTAALLVATAGSAAAQNLKVEFHDGRVTVDAQAVPVRVILTEWSKAGGTKIVGADRLSGAPLSVKLVNVTEAQALETILRSVAGYMAAPRSAGAAGPSMYDRILVMPTSSTPPPAAANARTAPQPNNAFNGTQRFVPPRRQDQPEQQEPDEAPEPDENPPSPPVFTFPQPGVNQPGQFQNAPPTAGQAGTITVNPANGGAGNITISPSSPSGPVGVSQPGMMVNPPAPSTPAAPGTMIRPPRGGNQ